MTLHEEKVPPAAQQGCRLLTQTCESALHARMHIPITILLWYPTLLAAWERVPFLRSQITVRATGILVDLALVAKLCLQRGVLSQELPQHHLLCLHLILSCALLGPLVFQSSDFAVERGTSQFQIPVLILQPLHLQHEREPF